MTAAAVGVLVEEGKLNWSTPVKQILPKFGQKNSHVEDLVNVADLLSHRTGLSDVVPLSYTFQGDGEFLLPKSQLYPIFESLPTSTSIRTGWQYLNSGYAIAGKIVETLSGVSFRDHLNATIFHKLGMGSTTLRPSDILEPSSLALPYASLANGTPFALPNRQVFENTFMEPAGGVYSSVNDLLKWSQSLLSSLDYGASTNASLPNIDYIMSNQVPIDNPSLLERSYGLGWVRTQLPGTIGLIGENMDILTEQEVPAFDVGQQSKLLVYHQGSTVGYYGCLLIFPETASAVVVLTNTAALNDVADWIARAYAETLFGKVKPTDYIGLATTSKDRLLELYQGLQRDVDEDRRPSTKPKSLTPFVGTYDHPTLPFSIEIVHDSSDLALLFQGKESHRYSLRHFRDNTFEWTLTRDETALRGRYDVWDPSYFRFNFTGRTSDDHFNKLQWSIIPEEPEVFTRRSGR
ncbi:hypothetical protein PRZ48_005137 [Zasmidium cellare]|uniref:Beta-lactamase/transpeptidase-like protein n=1 Tax=Zasmidium cellare TaxID=395010 RepID=A0ABR0ESM6_ZASCE|nr:hypothetical protein PRZ48_005137 [Zasmidium cellare]